MNRWVTLGIALCVFAVILNVAALIGAKFLIFFLAIPGLFIWWLLSLAFAWWVEAAYISKILGEDD